MKSPHNALEDAASIPFDLAANEQVDAKIITLGYQCADWNFLVCHAVMAEVLPLPKINPVPRSPSYCWGICNIRGNITPVFDLSEKLTGESEFKPRDNFYILLQGSANNSIGIVINKIPKSMHFEQAQLIVPPSYLPENLNEYIQDNYCQNEEVWHELDVVDLFKAT